MSPANYSAGLELDDAPDLDDEEEYDALNHETFGENAFQGDWEEDHTRFAEVTENSRVYRNSYNSERDDDIDLETSISQLVLEEGEEEDEDDHISNAIHKTSKSINIPDNFKIECSGDFNSSPVWSIDSPKKDRSSLTKHLEQSIHPPISKPSIHFLPPQLARIPTVQELERDLIQKNKQNNKTLDKDVKGNNLNHLMNQNRNFYQNVNQQLSPNVPNSNIQPQNSRSKFTHSSGSNKFPPGFGAHQRGPFPQPPQQEMVLLRNNQNMPMMLCPRLLPPYLLPTPHPLLLAQNARLVLPPTMMRYMPPHPMLMQQQQQQHQLHQNKMQQRSNQMQPDGQRNLSRNNNNYNNIMQQGHIWLPNPDRRGAGDFDEYAGLMNNREIHWLKNIQLIQLTTDKPQIVDYYYKEWLKKQEKDKKNKDQVKNGIKRDKPREPYFANNRRIQNDAGHRDRRDSERDFIANPSPREYVPLQFENSLGRLQCVSVTAPRKIIDLDVVSEPQSEATPSGSHRDSRKTKKLLLELERLYMLTMEIEEIDNTVNAEEANPQLRKPELLDKIMSSFLSEDRFVNFMCIRKGKTLLLRLLPHMIEKDREDQISDLWSRTVKSFPIIVRRDQNDGVLLQMYPYFKRWIDKAEYSNLSLLASFLLPGNVPNNVKSSSRAASPNSGKNLLSYALTSKFGVSVVLSILSQGEVIYPTMDDKEKLDWTSFVFNFLKHMSAIPNLENIPMPLEPLPANVSTAILNRSTGLNIQDYASAKRVLNYFQ